MKKTAILIFSLTIFMSQARGTQKSAPRGNSTLAPSLPNSIEAERSVLGAVVLNFNALSEVSLVVRPENFFYPHHKKIFSAMIALDVKGQPTDTITLMEELKRQGELDSVGGVAYLSQLTDGLPRLTNVAYYARIIKEKSALRDLIYSASAIQEQAFAQEEDASKIVERGVSAMLSLASDSSDVRVREWVEAAQSAVKEIEEEKARPQGVFRLRSGIGELDKITSGLRRKELALIVGPTSNGKSLLAQELSTSGDDAGYAGLIFSPEMTAENIAIRDVAYEADVPFWLTRRPEMMTDAQIENLKLASNKERNIAIVDRGITPERVWAMSEARKRARGLDFIVVDYDQLVIEAGINPEDEASFFGHQAKFVTQAKEFAKRLDVCFILVAQLRKMSTNVKEGKKPVLDDVYGASAMRNAPDVVIWVVREFFLKNMDKKYERVAKAYVVKGRNGRTGKVDMDFDPIRLRLCDKQGSAETPQDFDPFADTDTTGEES